MNEIDLIVTWRGLRWQIIASQIAPTFLLTLTIWFLLLGLADAMLPVKLAAAAILLASGVLGAVAQISAAEEALAVVDELKTSSPTTRVARRIAASAHWMQIVRILTPAVFVVIYLLLLWAIFIG